MKLSLAQVKSQMINHYASRKHSPNTIDRYNRVLIRLLNLTGDIDITTVTLPMIDEYRLSRTRDGAGDITLNHELSVIRSLFDFVAKFYPSTICLNSAQIELVKIVKKEKITILSQPELIKLFAAPDTSTLIGKRDLSILLLLYSSGARVREMVNLNIDDVDMVEGLIYIRNGKGGKDRQTIISNDAIVALSIYLQERGRDAMPSLFISFGNNYEGRNIEDIGRISTVAVEAMVKRYANKAGIRKRVTPHLLRHQFASDRPENVDVKSLQELLGHSSLSTTDHYMHRLPGHIKAIRSKFFKAPSPIVKEQENEPTL